MPQNLMGSSQMTFDCTAHSDKGSQMLSTGLVTPFALEDMS